MNAPPPSLNIRPFAAGDQQAARALVLQGLGEHFPRPGPALNADLDDIDASYVRGGHFFVVAELGMRMVAAGGLKLEGWQIGQIVRVSAAPEMRRMGIGRAVVGHLIEIARLRGLARVLVETNLDWEAAVGLYRNCGFREYHRDDLSVYMDLNPRG